MSTVLALAILALLVYILWRLFHRARASVSAERTEPHREFTLRRATGLLLVLFVVFGITVDTQDANTSDDGRPQTLAQPVPEPPTEVAPETTPADLAKQQAQVALTKEEARREVRRAVAARKAANRAKARRAQAVRERKAANRAKARAENETRRALAAQEAAAEAATSVYDDDDAAGDGNTYLDQFAGLNCGDIPATDFPTPPGDPEGWDRDNDGVSCES